MHGYILSVSIQYEFVEDRLITLVWGGVQLLTQEVLTSVTLDLREVYEAEEYYKDGASFVCCEQTSKLTDLCSLESRTFAFHTSLILKSVNESTATKEASAGIVDKLGSTHPTSARLN